jgi:hypothetical protein
MPNKSARSRLAVLAAALLMAASASPVYPAAFEGTPVIRQCTARALGARRGRPRKFDVPSRALTLTLPEDVIAALQAIDPDISRAIVRATQTPAIPTPATQTPSAVAELATYGNRAVIVVPQNGALKARTGAEFVPLADGRALIVLEETVSAAEFELRLGDALADARLTGLDRALFEKIAEILRTSRRSEGAEIEARSLIVLRTKPPRASTSQRDSRRLA